MKIFIAIGGLLVLLLSAVLVAPLFIDWTAFRADFEREASRILGQPVRVAGEAEARLLPFPSLTFTDVVVGPPDAEPVMTLARFRMDAELAPYLSGEIRIFQMTLDAPHLRVPLDGAASRPALSGVAEAAGSTVILENVVVTDGRVSLQNTETGRSREFSGIEAEISAQTLSGPFAGTGRLDAVGEALGFSLSSGRIEADGRFPFRLTLGSDRTGVDVSFDGQTRLGDGQADFQGRFDLASRSLTAAEPEDEPRPEAALPPLRLTGEVDLTRREAQFTALRAEIGPAERPYVLNGEGRFDIADIPHFDVTLRGEQVDVDRLAGEDGAPAGPRRFAERAEAVRATLAAVPRIDIPGRVSLALPIVTAGDTTIRDLSFSGSPSGDGWTISELRAELPGRTLLEASGLLEIHERFAFDGNVLVAAREPARFANWLSGSAPPQVAALARAGFSARARLSAEAQSLENLEVDVGGQRLLGRLERSGESGARSVSADLAGEAVDLDAFLAFAGLFVDAGAAFEPVDALDVRFEAGPVAYDGLDARALSLDFGYSDGLLDLRDLIAEGLEGADIEARGMVADLFAGPRPDLVAEITADDPRRIAEALAARWPGGVPGPLLDLAARAGPLAASLSASTPRDVEPAAIALDVEGTAGGTSFNIASAFENGLRAFDDLARFGLEATLSNEDPAAFMRQFGLDGIDLGLPSPLELAATLSGEGGAPARLSVRGTAPGSTARVEGTLARVDGGWDARLGLAAQSDDAALWLTAGGAAFGQGIDGLPVDLRADLALAANGDWTLDDLAGTLSGTRVAASLSATGGRVEGTADLGELPLPWLATLVYGVSPDLPAESGLWPAQPFAASLLPQAEIAVALTAERVDLGPEGALREASARLEGSSGGLRLADLAASFAGGTVSGDLSMTNSGGFGGLQLDIEAEGTEFGGADAPLGGRLSGDLSLEGSGRTFAELVGSLTGGGRAHLADGRLDGVSEGRLPAVLTAVDADEDPVEAGAVADLVAAQDAGARYSLGDVEAEIAVALGVAGIRPVTVERAGERVTGEGAFDLSSGAASGALTLAFLPEAEEAIAESRPEIAYRLEPEAGWVVASVEPLVSYLSLRAYRQEQERLEALREELRETVRLRREARFYRWRQAERDRVEAERLAVLEEERQRAEAEAERAAAEREAAERAEREAAEREAQERAALLAAEAAAARAAEDAARQQPAPAPAPTPPPPPAAAPPLDFDLSPPASPPPVGGYQGLPGVSPLPTF